MNEYIDVSFSVWAIIAFVVAFLSGVVSFKKAFKLDFDDVFWFSLALTLSWFFAGLYRVWWVTLRYMTDNSIPVNHMGTLVPLSLSFMVVFGGILHIRTLSKNRYGEKLWAFVTVIVSVIAFFMLYTV